jgi:hypothetical protein
MPERKLVEELGVSGLNGGQNLIAVDRGEGLLSREREV